MSERLVKVKLYGHLRKFGNEFELYVKSPAEAVHALGVMLPGFKNFLETAEHRGMAFAVFNGKQNITADELNLGAKTIIKIAPVYGGRKSGGGLQMIVGAILIAAAMYFSAGTAAGALGAWGAGGAIGTAALIGTSLVIGGIIQMLTPTVGGLKTSGDSENSAAYAFGGPVNTTAQGTPVGILYGEREIGGAVISAGIFAEDRA
jgi:predicted phage tail protein